MQVITTAAGGSVRRNPKGREIGFGRRIRLTPAGRGHPVFAGKDEVFDAVTIHLDEVEALAPNMHVLALNAFSAVQAAEVTVNGCTAWGVQYHPEYTLADIAASFRRHGKRLIEEKFFNDDDELNDYAGSANCDNSRKSVKNEVVIICRDLCTTVAGPRTSSCDHWECNWFAAVLARSIRMG